jgi:hypothetical protein
VTMVIRRTVAESSTVSFVKLQMFRLILTAVDWLLRLRATASWRNDPAVSSHLLSKDLLSSMSDIPGSRFLVSSSLARQR